MLDVDQPRELLLMKELLTLKHTRSLKDPPKEESSFQEVVPSLHPSGKSCLQEYTGRNSEVGLVHAGRKQFKQFIENNATHKGLRRGSLPNTSRKSQSFNESHFGQGSWDLGTEEAMLENKREQQEVFGGSHQDAYPVHFRGNDLQCTPTRDLYDDVFSLENWPTPGPAQDDAIQAQNSLQWESRDKRQARSMYMLTKGTVTAGIKDVFESRNCRKSPLTNQKRISRKEILSQQNSQVLSPLILSPYDDINSAGRPLPAFTLEEPLHDQQQCCTGGKQAGPYGMQSSVDMAFQSQCPLHGKHVGRSNIGEAGRKIWRSQDLLISSASSSQRTTSQGSLLGPWEASLNDELDVFELPKNGCGLPCYWSKSQKQGKHMVGNDGRNLSRSQKESADYTQDDPVRLLNLEDMKSLPLALGLSSASSDETSTVERNGKVSSDLIGELGLNSRNVKKPRKVVASHVANQLLSSVNCKELAIFVARPPRTLSQKYRPKIFEELVGQDLVAHALSNAILKGKIAPVYLFQGSRGTGKTSAARIFAAALNCMASVERRPCTVCNECTALVLGKSSVVWEVDAASYNGVENVRALLQSTVSAPSSTRYKVFIIDECHMLTDDTWNVLLRFLEEPPADFVFILITTDPDRLPRTASSRCQKFPFLKIKHCDIVKRLSKLVTLEKLAVELGDLDLIASKSDGSLRDAEMTLDQLSLFGQAITRTAVLDLVGLDSDEKLLSLLDSALCSDTVRTVQKARELVNSGVEQLDLMSRLATLITDILAGSYKITNRDTKHGFFSRHACSKEGLDRLHAALRILLEAEKQLRASSHDRTAWLTAALLQFGPHRPPSFLVSSTSTSATASPTNQKNFRNWRVSEPKGINLTKWMSKRSMANETSHTSMLKGKSRLTKPNFQARIHPTDHPFPDDSTGELSAESSVAGSSPFSNKGSERLASFLGPGNLGNIWLNILKGCNSLPLRHLLHSHGKLLAVCFSAVEAVVHLEFGNPEHKSRADRCRKGIANACKKALGLSVEVKISLASVPGGEEVLSSRVPLIADQTSVGKDCCQNIENAVRSENGLRAKTNSFEVGSLHHWRSQSGVSLQNMMEHAPNATMSALSPTSRSPDTLPAFGGCIEVCKSSEHETACIREARGFPPLKACYLQEFRMPRELQNVVRHSEIVLADAALSLTDLKNSEDGLHAQKSMHGGASPSNNIERNPEVYNLEEENLPKVASETCSMDAESAHSLSLKGEILIALTKSKLTALQKEHIEKIQQGLISTM